jgi:hypothetical protein
VLRNKNAITVVSMKRVASIISVEGFNLEDDSRDNDSHTILKLYNIVNSTEPFGSEPSVFSSVAYKRKH